MSHSDPRTVLRIAIAFAALKHKPRDQSIQFYLLDLQSRFPLATHSPEWRAYALELEKQIATLKAQRDADQELLSKQPTEDAPPKKKAKKNTNDPEWSWDQSRTDWSRFLTSQYPSSPSLISAYASLKGVLASPDTDLLSHSSRLTDAILRALDTIHLFLFSSPNPNLPLGPQHIDSGRIATTSPFLTYILRTALPAFLVTGQGDIKSKHQRKRIPVSVGAQADTILDKLLECVLLPLIRALAPLCFARLAPLVTLMPSSKKPGRPAGKGKTKKKGIEAASTATVHPAKTTDTRTDAFSLIGTSLEALDALPLPSPAGYKASSIASGIRDRLGLETIRELEALYSPSASEPEQPPSEASPPSLPAHHQSRTQRRTMTESHVKRLEKLGGTRAERVRVLATKDAGWFLASTLNLCVAPPNSAAKHERSEGLLREALLDRIGKLVRSVSPLGDDKLAVDPVCQNMLLAICERTMTQLAMD